MTNLRDLIEESDNIVFFGGAGVSTESGIPDFRSVDGLYSARYKYPPETILSHSFFVNNTAGFFDFYRNKMVYPNAKPNAAHKALAALEKAGKLKAVITQNIDGLHQMAGSKNVLELHGSVHRNRCVNCGDQFPLSYMLETDGVPKCGCGGVIKPEVVLYEESLDMNVFDKSAVAVENADMLIVGGTSLTVYPAAGLLNYYCGKKLVLINKAKSAADSHADYVFHSPIGEVFETMQARSPETQNERDFT